MYDNHVSLLIFSYCATFAMAASATGGNETAAVFGIRMIRADAPR